MGPRANESDARRGTMLEGSGGGVETAGSKRGNNDEGGEWAAARAERIAKGETTGREGGQ